MLESSAVVSYADYMAIDLQEYKELYLQTSQDLLEDIKSCLNSFDEEIGNSVLIDTAHRSAHSLKSQSLVMGYTQIGLAAKILEKLFKNAKDATITLDANLLRVAQALLEDMQLSLTKIKENQGELSLTAAINELENNTTITLFD